MIGITVYKDTIISHNDDDNLAEVFVEDEFANKYFNERLKEVYGNITFDEWFNGISTADDTENFYDYAKAHNAIIEIKDLTFEDCNFDSLFG